MKRISKLDEMQEMELLKIEHRGCWLAFWMLLASLIIQNFIFNTDYKTLAGEWIIFMVLCFYLAISCVRKGIWDRTRKMSTKANLIYSFIPSLILGVLWAVKIYRDYQKPLGSIAACIMITGTTFVLCFIALSLAMRETAKRQAKMEEEPSDADEI